MVNNTTKGGFNVYGIYSNDHILVDTAATEAEAKEIVESLNSPDPFALMFEKCSYHFEVMGK